MDLKSTPLSKCLDKKLKIFGYEIPDLLAIFLLLSILNFVFGQSFIAVWLPSSILAVILRYGKKGKPDNYLIHWIKFQVSPGIFSAFPKSTAVNFLKTMKGDV